MLIQCRWHTRLCEIECRGGNHKAEDCCQTLKFIPKVRESLECPEDNYFRLPVGGPIGAKNAEISMRVREAAVIIMSGECVGTGQSIINPDSERLISSMENRWRQELAQRQGGGGRRQHQFSDIDHSIYIYSVARSPLRPRKGRSEAHALR